MSTSRAACWNCIQSSDKWQARSVSKYGVRCFLAKRIKVLRARTQKNLYACMQLLAHKLLNTCVKTTWPAKLQRYTTYDWIIFEIKRSLTEHHLAIVVANAPEAMPFTFPIRFVRDAKTGSPQLVPVHYFSLFVSISFLILSKMSKLETVTEKRKTIWKVISSKADCFP